MLTIVDFRSMLKQATRESATTDIKELKFLLQNTKNELVELPIDSPEYRKQMLNNIYLTMVYSEKMMKGLQPVYETEETESLKSISANIRNRKLLLGK